MVGYFFFFFLFWGGGRERGQVFKPCIILINPGMEQRICIDRVQSRNDKYIKIGSQSIDEKYTKVKK